MYGLAGLRDLGVAGLSPDVATAPVVDMLRFASRGMVTALTDLPAATAIEGRFVPSFTISRHVQVDPSTGVWTGMAMASVSELELENTDRGLDGLLLSHQVVGRPVRLLLGAGYKDEYGRTSAPPLSEFGEVWRGTIAGLLYDDRRVRLPLQPDVSRLDHPMQVSTYGGTGGMDGTVELRGQTKPLMLGRVLAAEPTLVNPYLLIYQVHDGPIFQIQRVRDMGVELEATRDWDTVAELEALVPEGTPDEVPDLLIGQYATCLAAGIFRLGGQPAGRVTVEGRGRGDYISSAAENEPFDDGTFFDDDLGFANSRRTTPYAGEIKILTYRLLVDYVGIPEADVDLNQMLHGEDWAAGIYSPSGSQTTAREVISKLMQSGLMFCGRDRYGRWVAQKIAPPATVSRRTIDASNMVPDSLRAAGRPYGQPWVRWRVGYNRRWTTLTDSEIALSIGDGVRNFLKNPLDYVERTDRTLTKLFPEKKTGTYDTVLALREDALALLDELFVLFDRYRQVYTVSAYGVSGGLDLGDTVMVRAPKLGMDDGKNLLVIGIEENGRERTTDLVLFG